MNTNIFITKKLEKTLSNFLLIKEIKETTSFFGDWSANIFDYNNYDYCILMHRQTKYILIINTKTNSILNNFTTNFKETLYTQLLLDGIIINKKKFVNIIGKIQWYKTDNNGSASSSLNNYLIFLKNEMFSYKNFKEIPFREINCKINNLPNKMLLWKSPKEEMEDIIQTII